ncbi:MAG: hypothetical protein EXS59_02990 [Candidatus Taylorbacteria bacterium]|nr:hypothetical protein [Candidatus Taylorbacteria bacterium]
MKGRGINFGVLIIEVAVIVVGMVIIINYLIVDGGESAPLRHYSLYTDSPTEVRILDSAVERSLSTNLLPVAVYSVSEGKTNFSQCGAIYTNLSKGLESVRLLSTAHLFFKRTNKVSFVVRRITPIEETPSWCITRIITAGDGWADWIDLSECELGPIVGPTLPTIPCEFDLELSVFKIFSFDEINRGQQIVGPKTITSLITGESVVLRAIAVEVKRNSPYFLVDYQTFRGDSGGPFVGGDGALYFMGKEVLGIEPKDRTRFNLVSDVPGLVIGPVKIVR